jgi:hypothetical protein
MDDLPLIDRLYPATRVIHLVRDVRDHCLSMNDAWGKDIVRAAQRWADGVREARQAGRAMGDRYLELKYEDLLTDTEGVLRRACAFAELEFSPAMLELERPSENLGQAKGARKVVAANKGRFRGRMSARQLAKVEAIAGEAMEEFGYPLVLPPQVPRRLGPIASLVAQMRDGYSLVRGRRREMGLAGACSFYLRYYLTTRS